ncbi:hypothetical protein DL767_005258 [Monosporascus sp. MG133]|nr:hypothetical protein DL767_005258 [Monosporascus sp. MG133]
MRRCTVYECKAFYDTGYWLWTISFRVMHCNLGDNKEAGPVEYCKDGNDGRKIPQGSDTPSGHEDPPVRAVTYVPGHRACQARKRKSKARAAGRPQDGPMANPAQTSPESTAHPQPTPRPQIDDWSLPQIGDWLVSEDAAANLGSHDIPPPDIAVPNTKQLAFTSNPEQMPRQQSVPSGSLGSPTDATNTSSKDPATTHNLAGQQNAFAVYEFEWLSPQSGQPPLLAGHPSWRATPHCNEFNLVRSTTLLGRHSQQPT